MPATIHLSRAEAAYRVTFEEFAYGDLDVIGRRVAEVLREFKPTEIRVSADSGRLSVYVSVPVDTTPEMLDRKALALRDRWAQEPLHTDREDG